MHDSADLMLAYKRNPVGNRSSFVKPSLTKQLGMIAIASSIAMTLIGCVDNDPANSPAGPGIENPAAAGPNSVVPAIGGPAGNGGGVSGGAPSGAAAQ